MTSPTVWRRWLAHELLRLRRAAGLERADVAKRVRCTTQKIGHIETATVPPKTRDLEEVLLPMYGVPADRWAFYLQAAKDARKKGWWESHTDALPEWFSLYVGLEQGASEIRTWDPQLVHGLLQTEDYMAAVLRGGTDEFASAEVDRRVALRRARQAVLDAQEPLWFWKIISEDALHSNIGGPKVMRSQLGHLVEAAQRPHVTVQVLPRGIGAHAGVLGPFMVLGFPTEGDPGVVYLEHRTGAVYLEEGSEMKAHRIAFEKLRDLALSPTASVDLIAKTAEGLT